MSLEITFTQADLLRNTQLPASWYRLKVLDIEEKAGKSDPTSTTYHITCQVESGSMKGVPVMFYISKKQVGRIIEFITCFVDSPEPGRTYSLEISKGRSFDGWITYDPDMKWNSIGSVRAASAAA